jgi:hypothetical protein
MLSLFGLSSCSHCLIGNSPSASGLGFLATSYLLDLSCLIPCLVSTNLLFLLVSLTRVEHLMIISIIATFWFVSRHPFSIFGLCSFVLWFLQSSLFLCSDALARSLTAAGVYVHRFHHRSVWLPMVAILREECRTQKADYACEENMSVLLFKEVSVPVWQSEFGCLHPGTFRFWSLSTSTYTAKA